MNETQTVDGYKDVRQIIEHRRANQQRPNGSGNARRNYARYIELAREAAVRGDDVDVQNYYQHAEHYFRTMNGRE